MPDSLQAQIINIESSEIPAKDFMEVVDAGKQVAIKGKDMYYHYYKETPSRGVTLEIPQSKLEIESEGSLPINYINSAGMTLKTKEDIFMASKEQRP